jgi:hypothetical protein
VHAREKLIRSLPLVGLESLPKKEVMDKAEFLIAGVLKATPRFPWQIIEYSFVQYI